MSSQELRSLVLASIFSNIGRAHQHQRNDASVCVQAAYQSTNKGIARFMYSLPVQSYSSQRKRESKKNRYYSVSFSRRVLSSFGTRKNEREHTHNAYEKNRTNRLAAEHKIGRSPLVLESLACGVDVCPKLEQIIDTLAVHLYEANATVWRGIDGHATAYKYYFNIEWDLFVCLLLVFNVIVVNLGSTLPPSINFVFLVQKCICRLPL